jgi:hypothetical protein
LFADFGRDIQNEPSKMSMGSFFFFFPRTLTALNIKDYLPTKVWHFFCDMVDEGPQFIGREEMFFRGFMPHCSIEIRT